VLIINVDYFADTNGSFTSHENKLDKMSKILEHFMTFVPALPKEGEVSLPNKSKVTFEDTKLLEVG